MALHREPLVRSHHRCRHSPVHHCVEGDTGQRPVSDPEPALYGWAEWEWRDHYRNILVTPWLTRHRLPTPPGDHTHEHTSWEPPGGTGMNSDQQMVSWLAVFAIIIGVWLVYRKQLSHILFDAPGGQGWAGTSTIPPGQPGNPSGIGVIQPTPAPAGSPSGTYGTDQNGDLYQWNGNTWVPWGTTAPGNQPHPA